MFCICFWQASQSWRLSHLLARHPVRDDPLLVGAMAGLLSGVQSVPPCQSNAEFGIAVSNDHFPEVRKMVEIGSGAKREIFLDFRCSGHSPLLLKCQKSEISEHARKPSVPDSFPSTTEPLDTGQMRVTLINLIELISKVN